MYIKALPFSICTYRYKGAENISDPQPDGAKNPKKEGRIVFFFRTVGEPVRRWTAVNVLISKKAETNIELFVIKSVEDTEGQLQKRMRKFKKIKIDLTVRLKQDGKW